MYDVVVKKFTFAVSSRDELLVFDKRLTFGDHMHEKINKAYSVLGIIKRNFINMNSHSFNLLYLL